MDYVTVSLLATKRRDKARQQKLPMENSWPFRNFRSSKLKKNQTIQLEQSSSKLECLLLRKEEIDIR